jgi:hypothetical protein
MIDDAAAEDAHPGDELRVMGLAFLAFYNSYPEYFRLMFFVAHKDILASRPGEAGPLFEDGFAIRSVVADVVARGVADEALGRCNQLLTADVMWGALLGIVMVMEMERDFIRHTPEEMFARLAEILLAGLAPASDVSLEEG